MKSRNMFLCEQKTCIRVIMTFLQVCISPSLVRGDTSTQEMSSTYLFASETTISSSLGISSTSLMTGSAVMDYNSSIEATQNTSLFEPTSSISEHTPTPIDSTSDMQTGIPPSHMSESTSTTQTTANVGDSSGMTSAMETIDTTQTMTISRDLDDISTIIQTTDTTQSMTTSSASGEITSSTSLVQSSVAVSATPVSTEYVSATPALTDSSYEPASTPSFDMGTLTTSSSQITSTSDFSAGVSSLMPTMSSSNIVASTTSVSSGNIFTSSLMMSTDSSQTYPSTTESSSSTLESEATSTSTTEMSSRSLSSYLQTTSFHLDTTSSPISVFVSSDSTEMISSTGIISTTMVSSESPITPTSVLVSASVTSSIAETTPVTTTASQTTTPGKTTTPSYSYPTQRPNLDFVIFTISFDMVIMRNFSEINNSTQREELKTDIISALKNIVFSNITDVFEIGFREGSIIAEIETNLTGAFLDDQNTTLDRVIADVTDNFANNQVDLEGAIDDLDFNSSLDSLKKTKDKIMSDACSLVVADAACQESYQLECRSDRNLVCIHRCDIAGNLCGENGICFYDITIQQTSCRCTTSSHKVYHGPRCEDSTATLSFFLAISLGLGAGLVLIFIVIILVMCKRRRKSAPGDMNRNMGGKGSQNRLSARSNEAYYDDVYIPTMTADDFDKMQSRAPRRTAYDNPGYNYQECTAL